MKPFIHIVYDEQISTDIYLGVRIPDSERVVVAADNRDMVAVVVVIDLDFDFVADQPVGEAFDSEPVAVALDLVVDAVSADRLVVVTY